MLTNYIAEEREQHEHRTSLNNVGQSLTSMDAQKKGGGGVRAILRAHDGHRTLPPFK